MVNQRVGSVVLRSDLVEDDRQSQKMKQMINAAANAPTRPAPRLTSNSRFYSVPDLRMLTFV